MKKWVRRLPPVSEKKNFIFNMFGSTCNAAVSVLLLVFVSQILGDESKAGIFSLAFSTAQMMYPIATFELRNIQVTDVKREFSFRDVFMYRLISLAAMALSCIIFVITKGYSLETALLISVLCCYMGCLALSDMFQGELQINGYLAISGRSLGIQVLLAATAFIVTLSITKNLYISVIPMVAVVAMWILLHDLPYTNNFIKALPQFRFRVIKKMFLCAVPLFLSTFLQQYIFNSSKYAIDDYLTKIDQAHYGYLVMPTFCINLFSLFIFRPQLVSLSKTWSDKEFSKFNRSVMKLLAWVGILMCVALLCGATLGIPILNILYSTDLNGKMPVLIILLSAGGCSAISTLMITMLTVMRKQKFGIIAYLITFAVSLFLPELLVRGFNNLYGAAFAYLSLTALLATILLVIYIFCLHKAKIRLKKA